MRHQVIRSFIDDHTAVGYNKGNTFTSDDVERVAFLHEKGFLKPSVQHHTTKSIDVLKKQASELKIKGYTKMTAEELEKAIADLEKN